MKKNAFIIIGAGIAGLSTAIALKNIGIEATVVEASDSIRPVGAGLSLAANAMLALEHLQISEEVISKGRKLDFFYLLDKYGKVIKRVNSKVTQSQAPAKNFTIHRANLHQVLLSKIDKEDILTGKRSVGMSRTPSGFEVNMEDGTTLTAPYLIIAEGIHSPLRNTLVPEAKLRYAGYTCWRGIASNSQLQIDTTSETWGKEGRFGIVPLADNQLYWFACVNSSQQNERMRNYTLDDLAIHFKDFHRPILEILQSTPSENLIWGDICDIEPMQKMAFGNAVLIGDAAHATTPNMGQGACMALEDAVVLANCLRKNSKVSDAFKSFEQKRLARTHKIVNASWRLGKIAQAENSFIINLRDTLFRMMPQRLYERQIESLYQVKFD